MAAGLQSLIGKNLQNIINLSSAKADDEIKLSHEDTTTQYFLQRFWGNFVQIPNSDKILFEDLFIKSLEVIKKGLIKINKLNLSGQ